MHFSLFKRLNERSDDDSDLSAKTIAMYGPKFLMLKNKDNSYELPGGHIKKDETQLAGAMREFKEETGIYPKLQKVIFRKYNRVIYLGKINSKAIKLSNEHIGYTFVSLDDIKKIKLSKKAKIDFTKNLKFLFKNK